MEKKELDRLLRAADIIDIQNIMGRYLAYLDQVNFLGIYSLMAQDHPEITYEMCEDGAYIGPENVRKYSRTHRRSPTSNSSHNRRSLWAACSQREPWDGVFLSSFVQRDCW